MYTAPAKHPLGPRANHRNANGSLQQQQHNISAAALYLRTLSVANPEIMHVHVDGADFVHRGHVYVWLASGSDPTCRVGCVKSHIGVVFIRS